MVFRKGNRSEQEGVIGPQVRRYWPTGRGPKRNAAAARAGSIPGSLQGRCEELCCEAKVSTPVKTMP